MTEPKPQTPAQAMTDPKLGLDIEVKRWRENGFGLAWGVNNLYPDDVLVALKGVGAGIGAILEPLPVPDAADPVIGFILHSAALTTEATRLLEYLTNNILPFKSIVYCLSQPAPDFAAAFKAAAIEVVCVQAPTPMKKLLDLRIYAAIHKLSVAVVVGPPIWLATAAAMPIAPRVLWFYHTLLHGLAPDFGTGTNGDYLFLLGSSDVTAFILNAISSIHPTPEPAPPPEGVVLMPPVVKVRKRKKSKPKPTKRPVARRRKPKLVPRKKAKPKRRR